MFELIASIALALLFSSFAVQNTRTVSLEYAQYRINGVPLYIVILASLLIGLLITWILSIIQSISSKLTIHEKDIVLKDMKKNLSELAKQLHRLELENAALKAKNHDEEPTDDKSL